MSFSRDKRSIVLCLASNLAMIKERAKTNYLLFVFMCSDGMRAIDLTVVNAST